MGTPTITKNTILANIIHANYSVLMVLDRLGIKLGIGNNNIEEIAKKYKIDTGAFLIILNVFCNKSYLPEVSTEFSYFPDILLYLKKSHAYFIDEKIPSIQKNIKQLVAKLQDSKSEMLELFYNNYITEVTEHIAYENEVVFPYVEHLYLAYNKKTTIKSQPEDFNIKIYGDHHDDIENVLNDLKNIMIRHLPQVEKGNLRSIILQQLFELESDLYSHTIIENQVLIPLVKSLENNFTVK